MTRVVHCRREGYDVYIGRGTPWGNPIYLRKDTKVERAKVLAAFRELVNSGYFGPGFKDRVKRELKGKVLGCWCSPKACHGDVLAEIADE